MSKITKGIDLKTSLDSGVFSKIVRNVSSTLGLKPMPFKIIPIQLFRLSLYTLPNTGKIVDLSEYFIDIEGSVYSRNVRTYFTDYGMLLEKLSDSSYNNSGSIVNSFRSTTGRKVTIRRQALINMMLMGHFEDVTGLEYKMIDNNESLNSQVV